MNLKTYEHIHPSTTLDPHIAQLMRASTKAEIDALNTPERMAAMAAASCDSGYKSGGMLELTKRKTGVFKRLRNWLRRVSIPS